MLLPSGQSLLGLSLSFITVPLITEAAKVPSFVAQEQSSNFFSPENDSDNWDVNVPPNVNATGHLVFETVNSFLQHWPNTRYRNGHNIVPGTVRPGTVFYHGRGDANTPTNPDWLATDPEHSYLFCRAREEDSGCWQLTVTAIRPLNVLYFDGSAAAKMPDGSMDSQDILAYGKVVPDKYWSEMERIGTLCKWAKGMDVDGFVRMEMDFEIMLCDFTKGVQVEAVNLRAHPRGRRGPGGPGGPGHHYEATPHFPEAHRHDISYPLPPPSFDAPYAPPPPNSPAGGPSTGFESVISGSWHNYYPGETRIQLDLTRLVSFYDTDLVPSLVEERFGQKRIKHRLLGISQEDLKNVVQRIEDLTDVSVPGSGIDWATLIRLVIKRFSDRLEMVQYILNSTTTTITDSSENNKEIVQNAQTQFATMLRPYMLSTIKPSPNDQDPKSTEWVVPMYKRCSIAYTNYIVTSPSLHSSLTSSEKLILGGVQETTREICRVVTRMWMDGVMAGLDPDLYKPPSLSRDSSNDDDDDDDDDNNGPEINLLLESWRGQINTLMQWLDWSVWLKCRPQCGFEEMCYLPTWPFTGNEDFYDPQPRCLRRMASFQ